MRSSAIVWLVGLGLVAGCKASGNREEPKSVQPARVTTGEPLVRQPEHSTPVTPAPASQASTQPSVVYSNERFRLVNQQDEVVSVLDNGLTVIAKRVPSP